MEIAIRSKKIHRNSMTDHKKENSIFLREVIRTFRPPDYYLRGHKQIDSDRIREHKNFPKKLLIS